MQITIHFTTQDDTVFETKIRVDQETTPRQFADEVMYALENFCQGYIKSINVGSERFEIDLHTRDRIASWFVSDVLEYSFDYDD